MERFILFPKKEIDYFYKAELSFKNNRYEEAIQLFNKAMKIKYLQKDCIKYIIECHIELHHYDEVYKMIENEFVDKNINEEYLIKKYLYTMVLEGQYLEVNEIIKIYQHDYSISSDLYHYLNDLQIIIKHKLTKYQEIEDEFKTYFTSDRFEDHIQIILNLKYLDVDKYQNEIQVFLNNPNIDCFVRYNLLKYLIDNQLIEEISYTNYYNEKFLIKHDHFIDLLNDERYLEPPKLVLSHLENNHHVAKEIIENIWLNFCIKYYPNLISDLSLSCAVLHVLLLKAMNVTFDEEDICNLYKIKSERLFDYFNI